MENDITWTRLRGYFSASSKTGGNVSPFRFLGWEGVRTRAILGEFRETTQVQADINTVIPSMLREVFF